MRLDFTPDAIDEQHRDRAINFCKAFCGSNDRPKFLFGRSIHYAPAILNHLHIDGFIDDFTKERAFLGKPIIMLENVPSNGLVLNLSTGKPATSSRRLKNAGVEYLDYFSFLKYASLPLTDIVFNENFETEFLKNSDQYQVIAKRLEDELSRKLFRQLTLFRRTYNIQYLEGLQHNPKEQYFEPFLNLNSTGEVFVDIGGFDGETTLEFINHAPHYHEIYFFEPQKEMLENAKKRLKDYPKIHFFDLALSNKQGILTFKTDGSSSRVSESGHISIPTDTLDHLIDTPPTFIKMDIEGSESDAIDGARETIARYHPILAISIYHKSSDFWKIPQQVLQIYNGYALYVRHYTESIYETVMFFIPPERIRELL